MFKPTITERIIYKIERKTMPLFAPFRRKKLNNTDFTIISNNCWGGVCYDYFGIAKLSPTVGCFIMTDDYLKFIENLNYYLKQELVFITLDKSKHYEEWKKDPDMRNVPIGVLDDIEIAFLHYRDSSVAKEKWNRRVKRVNSSNLIFKFSYMNNCSDDDIARFVKMQLPGKKICFVKDADVAQLESCLVHYRGFEDFEQIYYDTFYWNKYFDVTTFINTGIIVAR